MAGRGHDQDQGLHGDWWSSLRAPRRRFRPTARDEAGAVAALPAPPAGDDDLAELQAVRARLAHEVSILDDRVGRLTRMKAAREEEATPPVDTQRLAAVEEKLRRAAEALAAAHALRLAVSDHLVAGGGTAPLRPAPAAAPPRSRWFLPLGLLAVLAALAIGALAATVLEPSESASPPPPRAAAAPEVPRCAELPANAGAAGAVSCTTGTALTIAAAGRTLDLRDLEARVLDVSRADGSLGVRMRLANRTQATQSLDERIYLAVAGRRYYATAEPIPAGAARTLTLTFPVGATQATAADLGVVPFGEPVDEEPGRLGVMRVTLPPA